MAEQICTRCVMDSSDPGIEFDENGVCSACKQYMHNRELSGYHPGESEKKLQETEKKYDDLLQEIRSVFSLVKEKENLSKDVDTTDGSSVGSEDQDDFPAFDDEDDFPADDDDIDEAEWV